MKAVQFAEYGGPEVLRLVEVNEPHASAGQVRIAVRAAGVNALDWKIRAGYMRAQMPISLPAGTGVDAAGVVDEVGDGVRDVAALDLAGSGVILELIALTGDPAKVLSIADFTAPEHGAQVSGTAINAVGAFAEAARLFTEGAFHIPVERTFPLAAAAEAHAASAAGHVVGRLVVIIS